MSVALPLRAVQKAPRGAGKSPRRGWSESQLLRPPSQRDEPDQPPLPAGKAVGSLVAALPSAANRLSRQEDSPRRTQSFVVRKRRSVWQLCQRGDARSLLAMLDASPRLACSRDGHDNSLLYYACFCGHAVLIRELYRRFAVASNAPVPDAEVLRCATNALNMTIRQLINTVHREASGGSALSKRGRRRLWGKKRKDGASSPSPSPSPSASPRPRRACCIRERPSAA